MRTNKSVPGPDGIPFVAYKTFAEPMLDMWVAAIQEAGEDVEWDGSFGNALLVLLKKVDGCPRPDQFRPISITNAQYRVIVRYWALWFARQIGVLSETQAAMAQGRVIDSAVEAIADEMWERVATGKSTTMLQTDFMKAYDFINRDAILRILEAVNAPRQIINLSKKIYQDSQISLNTGEENYSFTGRTGVKQGCPISPLIYCIIFDLLVSKIPHVKGVTAAYVDDNLFLTSWSLTRVWIRTRVGRESDESRTRV